MQEFLPPKHGSRINFMFSIYTLKMNIGPRKVTQLKRKIIFRIFRGVARKKRRLVARCKRPPSFFYRGFVVMSVVSLNVCHPNSLAVHYTGTSYNFPRIGWLAGEYMIDFREDVCSCWFLPGFVSKDLGQNVKRKSCTPQKSNMDAKNDNIFIKESTFSKPSMFRCGLLVSGCVHSFFLLKSYHQKIEWYLTNGPRSKLRSSY